MPEIRMPDLTAETLASQMHASARAVATGVGDEKQPTVDLNPATRWTLSASKAFYKAVSFVKAKAGLKVTERKSERYRKWPRSWFRSQARIDAGLIGVIRQLVQMAGKFDAGLRKHDKVLRRLLPKVEVLHYSAVDLQREFLHVSRRADQMEGQLRQCLSLLQQQSQTISRLNEGASALRRRVTRLESLSARQAIELNKPTRRSVSGPPEEVPSSPGTMTAPASSSTDFESLYLEFEGRFRGSGEEVTERLKEYLPILERACPGSRPLVALDIGSGRGEWLRLLKQHGVIARGVDANPGMVSHAIEQGLEITLGNGLDYLRNLPSASLGLVTAFHVVEHLKIDELLVLIEETARVLVPGGMAIFETPNPANLRVSTFTFHLDPTHRQPIPSHLLEFLCQSVGLTETQVLELHPEKGGDTFPEEGSPKVSQLLNQLFHGPRDYAVIARTPA
ncbi:class I SAM-dependent methyltransferase [Verrucomicrobium spinosum]|uniref:class I SAM-dependent methyltransferase n=2 Tax=Verrucomicrobium spinosum TaxID=2736 RepID=UPI0002F8A8C6|nr:class I SAM-dependent methyltransferase [Verrucomicrobium spinosum]